jgi:hypothetical protein
VHINRFPIRRDLGFAFVDCYLVVSACTTFRLLESPRRFNWGAFRYVVTLI